LQPPWEKKGDWVSAMEEYRKAATRNAANGLLGLGIGHKNDRDPQKEYSEAQGRFKAHLTALKAAGKTAEASKLESAVSASQLNTSDSAKLDAAMQAGFAAIRDGRSNDALQHYKEAVDIAEKMKIRDRRLSVALGELGRITLGFKRFDEANTIFQRQLQVVEETAGPGSPEMIEPLENMGMSAMYKQDYEASRAYLTRSLELAKKNYGESNTPVAAGLHKMALTYFAQQDYANAEMWLLRAVKIDDEIDGYDGFQGAADVNTLCAVYDRAGKPDKAVDCYAKLAAITQRRFGAENPVVAQPLTSEASALRSLGRNEEAAKIEQRIKALQASASNQN
jgi:tetratricopeptide (TPR) repeat protein